MIVNILNQLIIYEYQGDYFASHDNREVYLALIKDPWNALTWPYPLKVNSSMSHAHMDKLSFLLSGQDVRTYYYFF